MLDLVLRIELPKAVVNNADRLRDGSSHELLSIHLTELAKVTVTVRVGFRKHALSERLRVPQQGGRVSCLLHWLWTPLP